MLKKSLYFVFPLAILAVIGAQTANADYYDCEGNIRPGNPGPFECHYLTVPPVNSPTPVNEAEDTAPKVIYPFFPQIRQFAVVTPNNAEEDEVNDVEIRNTRKYCVRNYCYFIFEICYSNGYCEQKAERVERGEYEDNHDHDYDHNNWRNQLNNYVYNYFYYNYYYRDYNDCDYRHRDCVYRGPHYGRYTNRYWDF